MFKSLNVFVISFLLLNVFLWGHTYAQGDTSAADLGVANPGLLPTSPFYFLKEFKRGIQGLFTFNPVAKVELELKIANEKAAEVLRVQEVGPTNEKAVVKAFENYKGTQYRLKIRLEAMRETSENPRVDALLERVVERTVKHERLFEDIVKKFEDKTEIQAIVSETNDGIEEAVTAAASKDKPAEFVTKLEKALVESKRDDLDHVRSVEMIDRLRLKAPRESKDALQKIKEEFTTKLNEDLSNVLKEESIQSVQKRIEAISGDPARRSLILEEIKGTAVGRVAEVVGQAALTLEKSVEEDEKHIALKAKEQIEHARFSVQELRSRLGDNAMLIARLLTEAENNLKKAETAYAEGRYGLAFGQARSAESLARNGLKTLAGINEESPDAGNLQKELEDLAVKIEKYAEWVKEKGLADDADAVKLLANAREHLGFARNAFTQKNLSAAKVHIGHVIGFLRDISRIIERHSTTPIAQPTPAVPPPASLKDKPEEELICTQEYNPVCGANGKTYSNKCYAAREKIEIKYIGECRLGSSTKSVCGNNVCEADEVVTATRDECSKDSLGNAVCATVTEQKFLCEIDCKKPVPTILPSPSIKTPGFVEPTPPAVQKPLPVPETTVTPLPSIIISSSVSVVIDEKGQFSPSVVQIKKGGKVTWTNKSERAVWPASDFHPVHNLYPGFDALRGLKTGEEYSFIFEKAGKWPYHDHLNSSTGGVVEVTE